MKTRRKGSLIMSADDSGPLEGAVLVFALSKDVAGACRVIRRGEDGRVLVALCSWVGNPTLGPSEPEALEVLRLTHHNCNGSPLYAWLPPQLPAEFRHFGPAVVSKTDANVVNYTSAEWTVLSSQLVQWRWDNQREALQAEEREKRQSFVAEEEATRRRLVATTLASLRRRRWFTSWKGAKSNRYSRQSRAILRRVIDLLIELGPRPTRKRS